MISALRYFLFKKRRQKYLDGMYEVEDPWSAQNSQPRVLSYLTTLENKPYKTVLDIGCGEGLFAEALSKRAQKYYGVDVSETALMRAKEKNKNLTNIHFLHQDFDRLAELKESFDLLIFNFVLDYLGFQKHPRLFAQNLYILLKEKTVPDTTIVLINPVYTDQESDKINQYIYLFNNFGFQVVQREIIIENTFKIACVTLKNKVSKTK